jgi:hypothetical protein
MAANWPGSISTDAQLYVAVNSLETTLASTINASVMSISVASTTSFPTTGAIAIDDEVIFYTGISGPTFTGCTRGADGTTATSHNSGVPVAAAIVAQHHNALKDEIEAIEASLNLTPSRVIISNSSGRLDVSSVTPTELSYLSGITSSIQTQIGTKATDTLVVHLSGTEIVTGNKSFTGSLIERDPIIDARSYGAIGDNSTDNTTFLQNAINAAYVLPGGIVLIPAGTYKHTGLTLKAGVRLKGTSRIAVVLDYTPATGNAITLDTDADKSEISDLQLKSSGATTGIMVYAPTIARQFRMTSVSISGSLSAISVIDALDDEFDQLRIDGKGNAIAGGIGINFGNVTLGGNACTVSNSYISDYQIGVKTYCAGASFFRCIFELDGTGLQNYGRTVVYHPYCNVNATYDFDLQVNGLCLVGYGSQSFNIHYADTTTQARTIIIPDTFDLNPATGKGLKLGELEIDRDGVLYNTGPTSQIALGSTLVPKTDNGFDLGTSALQFGYLYSRALQLGKSGAAGTFDLFPPTALKGKVRFQANDSAGDTVTNIVNASQAATRIYTIPDAGANASFVMTVGGQTVALGAATFSGIVTEATQPCFAAENATGSTNATGDGTVVTCSWPTERFDKGSNFSSTTFTAPVTGIYLFTGSLLMSGLGAAHTRVDMIIHTTARDYQGERTDPQNVMIDGLYHAKVTAIANMTAGDVATLTYAVSNGTKVVGLNGSAEYNYFQGTLLN